MIVVVRLTDQIESRHLTESQSRKRNVTNRGMPLSFFTEVFCFAKDVTPGTWMRSDTISVHSLTSEVELRRSRKS